MGLKGRQGVDVSEQRRSCWAKCLSPIHDMMVGWFHPLVDEIKQLCSHPRLVLRQVVNLGCVILSALMLWKALMLCSGSKSPVVVVLSGSMEPGFHRGDILFLTYSRLLHPGEVVVFQVDGREIPIVHRAMNVHYDTVRNMSLLTKGDNNEVNDRGLYAENQLWLANDNILGTAEGFLPYVGMLTIWLNENPWLKYILICGMGLLVILGRE